MKKIEINKNIKEELKLRLKTGGIQTMLTSEFYSNKSSCENVIKSIKNNVLLKKSFIFLFFLVFSLLGFSQDNEKIVPDFASPEIASFMKYEDINVSKYTGTPNISIPVYTLTDGEVVIPINLRYHASGIKVEEEASWVGLGWNLNVGGHISRRTNGRVDENCYDTQNSLNSNINLSASNPYGYSSNVPIRADMTTSTFTAANAHFDQYMGSNPFTCFYNDDEGGYPIARMSNGFVNAIAASREYYIPDLYSFTIPGNSGKFVIKYDNNKEILLINENSPLKVKRFTAVSSNNTTAWEITDSSGVIYEFTEFEIRHNPYSYYKDRDTPVTFYLTKITYAKGDTVDFIYEEKPLIESLNLPQELYMHVPNVSVSGGSGYTAKNCFQAQG